MTASQRPEQISPDWFRRYVRDAVRNSEKNDPRDIAGDLIEAGFTYEEALAAVAAMLPEYVRQECSMQGRRDREVPRAAEPVDVFKVESETILTSTPAKTRRRNAAKRTAERRRNAEQLTEDTLLERFLNGRIRGMEHKRWRDMTVEDFKEAEAMRRRNALQNRASADRFLSGREVLEQNNVTVVSALDKTNQLKLLEVVGHETA
jgi:hypothetical protein